MAHPHFLVLLVFVPIVAYFVARRHWPAHLYAIVGAALGAVVSPLALGLYSFYFLSPWGLIPGFLGLVLTLIHGVPGFKVAAYTGLTNTDVISGWASSVIIELINGLCWGLFYATVGLAVDRSRRRRSH